MLSFNWGNWKEENDIKGSHGEYPVWRWRQRDFGKGNLYSCIRDVGSTEPQRNITKQT